MLAVSLGGIASIIIAIGVLGAAVFLSLMLLNAARVLDSTKSMIDGVKDETVPLLGEVRVTVESVNKELDRADTVLESAGNIAKSAARLTETVEKMVSSPLMKIIALSAGMAKAAKRFTGRE